MRFFANLFLGIEGVQSRFMYYGTEGLWMEGGEWKKVRGRFCRVR